MGDIVKRVSLEGLAEGFDQQCFAYVRPATVLDKREFRAALDSVKKSDLADDWQQKFVIDHFVSGCVNTLTKAGAFELADMTTEHLQVQAISDRLFAEIMGINLDPKDFSAAVAQELKQADAEANTSTQSSTASPATSQTT